MTWIIFLAGFMAIFGVIGYLRGTKAAIIVLLAGFIGLLIIGPYGEKVVSYINAFGKGFRFLSSGGMAALSGSGSADNAIQALQGAPAVVQPTDAPIVLGLLYVVLVFFGLLISGIPWFSGKKSVGGLLLGLLAGYLVGGVVARALWPQYTAFLPLPILEETVAPATVAVAPGAGAGIGTQVVNGLSALANSGLVPFIIAIAIVLFIIAATRTSNRGAKG